MENKIKSAIADGFGGVAYEIGEISSSLRYIGEMLKNIDDTLQIIADRIAQ